MKRSLLFVAVLAVFSAAPALANNDCRGGTQQSGGNCNEVNNNQYGGNATGGSASATGGAGGAGGSVNIGTGVFSGGNFSPSSNSSATIQRGAVEVENTNKNTNKNYNTNVNSLSQRQGQEQGQKQGQGQGQFQGNVGLGSGNQTSVQIDAPVIPADTSVKNVPSIGAPNVYPANSCALGFGIGGSGLGGGGGIGVSWESADCRKQEVARQFASQGQAADANAVLCSIEAAKVAPVCKALVKKAEAEEAQRVADAKREEQERRAKVIKTEASAAQVVATANPTCYADQFIAARMGKPICK